MKNLLFVLIISFCFFSCEKEEYVPTELTFDPVGKIVGGKKFDLSQAAPFSNITGDNIEVEVSALANPYGDETESSPCDFEWNDEAKDFAVTHSYLSEMKCQDGRIQRVIIFEVQLSPTSWEQFGYDLNVAEKKSGCITHYYNDNPQLLWRKIIYKS